MEKIKLAVLRRLRLRVSDATCTNVRRRNSQKHIVPVDNNMTAKPTKNGPAAPVTLSPNRSSHLKQRKTYRAQIIDVRGTNKSRICHKHRCVLWSAIPECRCSNSQEETVLDSGKAWQ